MLLSRHPRVNRVTLMPTQLTRPQWEQLEAQMSRTPSETDSDGIPGEHMQLIALLNQFGFSPMSKQEALRLAEQLLEVGWAE
jgi:hypothetical protein